MGTIIKKLDRQGYRNFGLITSCIIGVLFGLILPWLFGFKYPSWPWLISGVLLFFALVYPIGLQPVYIVWMKFGYLMNWVNTRLILGIIYFCVFLPTGIIMKLFGNDPMQRKLTSKKQSYRVASETVDRNSVEKPY